jgi:hypothetical protein
MNEETMRELIRQRPFRPFEVQLSSGERHKVRHPENVLLTRSHIVVAKPKADRLIIISLLHVARCTYI